MNLRSRLSRLRPAFVAPAILLTAALFLHSCGDDSKDNGPKSDSDTNATAEAPRDGMAQPPHFGTYPAEPAVIQRWIDEGDMAKIRAHAWDIWGSITSPSGVDDLPVWETWYSGHDIFELSGTSNALQKGRHRRFENPRQFHHTAIFGSAAGGGVPRDPSEEVTSFNRYSPNLGQFIWKQRYNKAAVFDSINQAYDAAKTPVIDRGILVSADSTESGSIALKPVFQFISDTGLSVIPYWDGISPQTTTNLANPTPDTWRQAVVVDPSGKLKPGSTVVMSFNSEKNKTLTVVSLDDFYHVRLTQTEADSFSTFALNTNADIGAGISGNPDSVKKELQEGDIALFVAMHVTTKEIPNWTWQTFWWSAKPDDPLYGKDRPASIKGPWAHYNMTTAYFMTMPASDPEGDPWVGFNPYLETALTGTVDATDGKKIKWTGVTSNCMTCHRLAAWKQNPGGQGPKTPNYQPDGFINPADSLLFSGFTKLDFLWSLTRAE